MSGMLTANHGAIGLRSNVRSDFWRNWRIHSGSPFHHDIWSTTSVLMPFSGLNTYSTSSDQPELVTAQVEIGDGHQRTLPSRGICTTAIVTIPARDATRLPRLRLGLAVLGQSRGLLRRRRLRARPVRLGLAVLGQSRRLLRPCPCLGFASDSLCSDNPGGCCAVAALRPCPCLGFASDSLCSDNPGGCCAVAALRRHGRASPRTRCARTIPRRSLRRRGFA